MQSLLQVLLLVFLALFVKAQLSHPTSPCSRVFSYEENTAERDTWYGEILLSTDAPLRGIRLDVQLDAPAKVLGNWIGEVSTKDNRRHTILNLTSRLEPGPPKSVRIFVKFGEYDTVPRVRSIALNGRQICPTAHIDDGSLEYSPTTKRTNNNHNGQSTTNRMNGNNFNPTQRIPSTKQPFNNKNTSPARQTTRNQYERSTTPISYTQRTTGRPPNSNTIRPTSAESQKKGTTINAIPFSPVWPDEEDSKSPGEVEWITPIQSTTYRPITTSRTTATARTTTMRNDGSVRCGTIDVQATPLVTNGQRTLHGQWPWHTAIYQSKGTDLSYKCGGSLISKNSIITAAHCVTSRIGMDRPVEADTLLVYLGKYHLKLWSEGGVQNKQVSYVYVHPNYNSSDFRADLAILILSSPADFTTFVRPVCMWGSSNTDVQSLENVEGYIVGWGYDETGRVTDELMLAKMPVVSQQTCLFSHPQFYSRFANNNTYCAGFRNGTSVCNGDSGGGMVFPQQARDGSKVWQLRGIVSISVSQDDQRVCDTRHYVVFTDIAKYLDWIRRNMKS